MFVYTSTSTNTPGKIELKGKRQSYITVTHVLPRFIFLCATVITVFCIGIYMYDNDICWAKKDKKSAINTKLWS